MQALLIHKCAPFHYFTSQAFLNSHLFITSHFYTIVSILYQFENIFNLHNIAYFLCPWAFKEIVWTFYQNNILMQAIFMYVYRHTLYLLLAFSSASADIVCTLLLYWGNFQYCRHLFNLCRHFVCIPSSYQSANHLSHHLCHVIILTCRCLFILI